MQVLRSVSESTNMSCTSFRSPRRHVSQVITIAPRTRAAEGIDAARGARYTTAGERSAASRTAVVTVSRRGDERFQRCQNRGTSTVSSARTGTSW